MRTTRRWIAVALVLLAALAVPAVDATPAAAAACTYHGCDGRDPHNTRCDVGARDLKEWSMPAAEDGGLHVQLRYSPTCHAAWVKSTVVLSGFAKHQYIVLKVYHSASGGGPALEYWKRITHSTGDLPPSGTEAWTPMHSFSDWVQGCSLTINNVGYCTGRY
jgi:hypothetical protein